MDRTGFKQDTNVKEVRENDCVEGPSKLVSCHLAITSVTSHHDEMYLFNFQLSLCSPRIIYFPVWLPFVSFSFLNTRVKEMSKCRAYIASVSVYEYIIRFYTFTSFAYQIAMPTQCLFNSLINLRK